MKSIATLLVLTCHFLSFSTVAIATKKPNILFILTDDQSYNTIHALGNKHIHTPNMDELVQRGTSFSHAYNMGAWHGAVCVASRTMLLTGLSVWTAMEKEAKLDSLAKVNGLWSQLLKTAGYSTYMTGKWHVATDAASVFDYIGNLRPGMPSSTLEAYSRPTSLQDSIWLPWDTSRGGYWKGGRHWSEVQAEDAQWFIQKASKDQSPFFMYLAFNAPHDPRQSPAEFIEMYPLDKLVIPENFIEDYPYKEEIGCGKHLRDEQLAPWPRTAMAVKRHLQEYYALISHLDHQIGKVLQALKDAGAYDNTVIILASDHGLAIGSHGLMGKQNMFDHSIRVPLIICGPGIPTGEVRHQQVYLQDVMPSTLQLAGVPNPQHVFFNSFLHLLEEGSNTGSYEEIYGCYMDLQRMVRTDRYKLIAFPKADKLLLYDLLQDPFELHDLSDHAGYRDVLQDMKVRMLRQQALQKDKLVLNM